MSASTLLVLIAAAALAGCGVGPGESPGEDVGLKVTGDYGSRPVLAAERARVEGADTVMRVLQRSARVGTRFGGDFVESIDGIEGGRRGGRPVDWFLYVNGVLTGEGAGAIAVHGGDRIWWDHHDWGFTPDVPAVVGSFPAPFAHGPEGRRLPVRVECDEPRARPCATVVDRLRAVDVDAASGPLRAGGGAAAADVMRVLVGRWTRLRARAPEAEAVDAGPRSSGVFARFDEAGDALALLDQRGRVARTLRRAGGLVAATRTPPGPPVWFVTGTDDDGVASAAGALDERTLEDRFALALTGGQPLGAPVIAKAAAP